MTHMHANQKTERIDALAAMIESITSAREAVLIEGEEATRLVKLCTVEVEKVLAIDS